MSEIIQPTNTDSMLVKDEIRNVIDSVVSDTEEKNRMMQELELVNTGKRNALDTVVSRV